MEKFYTYLAVFLAGMVVGIFLVLEVVKDKINNSHIDINKPKMKNNTDSTQQFTSDITGEPAKEKRKLLNFLKRKKK
jgi:hypothetical protein